MAAHKSAEKRNRQTKTKTLRNRRVLGALRTALKKARTSVDKKTKGSDSLVKQAIRAIDKAVTKGVVHKSAGSRLVSRIARRKPVSKAPAAVGGKKAPASKKATVASQA